MKKIVVIDDNEGDRRLICDALTECGMMCETTAATSGAEGVDLCRLINPDLVVVDTKLTGIDGFETCRLIKNMESCSAKVVVMTGIVDAVDAVKARIMGADDYCVKTSDSREIVRCVRGLLEGA